MTNDLKEWWFFPPYREDKNLNITAIIAEATKRGRLEAIERTDDIVREEMDKTRRVNVSDADFLQWRTETGNAILSRLAAYKKELE